MKVHSKRLQFARELKVTTKYGAKCRIHARIRKKIKTQLSFQRRVKRLIASRRLNLIKVVHFTSVPACSSLSS